ncbi:hypothetical protein GCM10027082_39240 [Comamonas humi]
MAPCHAEPELHALSLLSRMHRPDLDPKAGGPAIVEKQDKRPVVPIWESDGDRRLHGSVDDAMALIQLPRTFAGE